MAKIEYLFETNALQMAPANSPFWLTSGLLSPFYVNTQFLCGGKDFALQVLDLIDNKFKKDKEFFHELNSQFETCYNSHSIYKEIIDNLTAKVATQVKENDITYVSGGARRDWFFSVQVAKNLDLPHIYLSKEKEAFDEKGDPINSVTGNVINIADLLTLGSSYVRAWSPAIKELGGNLIASANVVDRCQGGEQNLNECGIKSVECLLKIDSEFFDKAFSSNLLEESQYKIAINYLTDPHVCMQSWLKDNPDFLENAIKSDDSKVKQRAQTLIDKDLYNLNG